MAGPLDEQCTPQAAASQVIIIVFLVLSLWLVGNSIYYLVT